MSAWRLAAACRDYDPEMWFAAADSPAAAEARSICTACPVQAPCLEAALAAERNRSRESRYGIRRPAQAADGAAPSGTAGFGGRGMTGRGGVGRPVRVVAWLRIDCGQQTRGGRWLRYPAADYACLRCGWSNSASGDAVPEFASRVRAAHADACTARNGGTA